MKRAKLDDMVGGWFVGSFDPTVLSTTDVEVAVKHYGVGAVDALHMHKIATELTVMVEGTARMAGQTVRAGDIVMLEPGEPSDFEALTAVTLVVVKHPGAKNDKYEIDDPNA